MNLEEFEFRTRETIEQTLNQLQAATLLVAELENRLSETGREVQELSLFIEQFIAQQRNQ